MQVFAIAPLKRFTAFVQARPDQVDLVRDAVAANVGPHHPFKTRGVSTNVRMVDVWTDQETMTNWFLRSIAAATDGVVPDGGLSFYLSH